MSTTAKSIIMLERFVIARRAVGFRMNAFRLMLVVLRRPMARLPSVTPSKIAPLLLCLDASPTNILAALLNDECLAGCCDVIDP